MRVKMKKYINRIADSILEKKLKGKGAVLIQGPKWCGKPQQQNKFQIVYCIWQSQKIKNKI